MSGEWGAVCFGERIGPCARCCQARDGARHVARTIKQLVCPPACPPARPPACLPACPPARLPACLPACSGVPIIGMSALTGRGAEQLLPAALAMYERWNLRVPTSKLNRWVEKASGAGEPGGLAVWRRACLFAERDRCSCLCICKPPRPLGPAAQPFNLLLKPAAAALRCCRSLQSTRQGAARSSTGYPSSHRQEMWRGSRQPAAAAASGLPACACLHPGSARCAACPKPRVPLPEPALTGSARLRALQIKARPPTFVVWVSGSTPLSVPSQRFLAGQIRRHFGFGGVPLRILVRHKPPRKQRGRK